MRGWGGRGGLRSPVDPFPVLGLEAAPPQQMEIRSAGPGAGGPGVRGERRPPLPPHPRTAPEISAAPLQRAQIEDSGLRARIDAEVTDIWCADTTLARIKDYVARTLKK